MGKVRCSLQEWHFLSELHIHILLSWPPPHPSVLCGWSGLFTRRLRVYLSAGRSWPVGQTALQRHGLQQEPLRFFRVRSQCLSLSPRLAGRWAEVSESISSRARANRPFPHTLTFPGKGTFLSYPVSYFLSAETEA